MKKSLLMAFIMFSLVFNTLLLAKGNSMKVTPAKPKAGDEVTVTYNPANTELAAAEKIDMVVYSFSLAPDEAKSVELKKAGTVFTGKFKVGSKTEFIGLVFQQGDTKDANDQNGYFINIYDKKGKLTDGSLVGSALIYSSWGRYFGVKADPKAAYDNFENVAKTKLALKEKYVKDYISGVTGFLKDKGFEVVAAELKKLEQKSGLVEQDYSYLQNMYAGIKLTDKANEIKKIALAKYPKGQLAAYDVYVAISKEKDLTKKVQLVDDLNNNMPGSMYFTYAVYSTSAALIKDGKTKEAADLVNKYIDKLDVSYLSAIASQFLNAKQELATATNLYKMSVDKSRQALASDKDKPAMMTEKDYVASKKLSLAYSVSSLAGAYADTGNKTEALKCYEEAIPQLTGDNADPDVNAKYVKVLFDLNQIDKASKMLETFITDGTGSADLKALAKDIYVKKNGSEAGYPEYIEKLNKAAHAALVERLKKEMINQPAPNFTLANLDGKKITLSELKGKVVIVDFWATWCGPCRGSFPGMQLAVDKWKGQDVEFLFLNTWENAPADKVNDKNWKHDNAASFITQNKYTFNVLLDEESKVVADYGVSGIPTKFVIDKNGNIRFKVIGSDGISDKILEEVSTMIEMIK